jgi:hypothetical protein
MVDVVWAVVHLNLWAGSSAQAADSHLPAKKVLMTATNPDQELADLTFRGIGRHLE